MKLTKLLTERILSVIGVLLIAIAIDGFLSPQIFVYNAPTLGGVVPLLPSPETVSQIVAITDWPFYAPLLIGCILVAIDVYYLSTKNKVKIA
jgi:uncharacterized membrane protein